MKIKAFLDNFNKITQEKNISKDELLQILEVALKKAYLKENPDVDVEIKIDLAKERVRLYEKKIVVSDDQSDIDEDHEIRLTQAQAIRKNYKVGSKALVNIDISSFERRLAVHFAQLFRHHLNDLMNNQIYNAWHDKKGFIIKAEVDKIDYKSAIVNLNDIKGVVPKNEMLANERLIPGKSYIFLIKEVKQKSKLWPVILSRCDDAVFRYVLQQEVSEIADGLIEIVHLARIPGFKAKVALKSNQYGIDPISIIVGHKGVRIKKISEELANEKIDVFLYDSNPKQFLVNAAYPSKVWGLHLEDNNPEQDDNNPKATIVVETEEELAKIIGQKSENLRLLRKLTKWDIKVVTLALAKEQNLVFEDLTHLISSKSKKYQVVDKKNPQNFQAFDYKNEQNNTQQNTQSDWTQITDEDVEKFLQTNKTIPTPTSVLTPKKKSKKSKKSNNNDSLFNQIMNSQQDLVFVDNKKKVQSKK